VLPRLIEQGRFDEVLAAFQALVERNEKLERQLAELVERRRFKPNEGVSSDQLLLFVKQLRDQATRDAQEADAPPVTPALAQANARLQARADAAADRARQKFLTAATGPAHKPLKRPLPEHLPRHEHEIEVPERERACPTCAQERVVIGHDVSEVLELEPAKLYVRVDRREKRACRHCEAHVVRAATRSPSVVRSGAAWSRTSSTTSSTWACPCTGSERTSVASDSGCRRRPCATR